MNSISRMISIHPDGLFYFLQGMLYFNDDRRPEPERTRQGGGRLRQGSSGQVVDQDRTFREVFAMAVQWMLADEPSANPAMLKKAAETMRKSCRLGTSPGYGPVADSHRVPGRGLESSPVDRLAAGERRSCCRESSPCASCSRTTPTIWPPRKRKRPSSATPPIRGHSITGRGPFKKSKKLSRISRLGSPRFPGPLNDVSGSSGSSVPEFGTGASVVYRRAADFIPPVQTSPHAGRTPVRTPAAGSPSACRSRGPRPPTRSGSVSSPTPSWVPPYSDASDGVRVGRTLSFMMDRRYGPPRPMARPPRSVPPCRRGSLT